MCTAVTLRKRLLQLAQAVRSMLRFGCALLIWSSWLFLMFWPVIGLIFLRGLGIDLSDDFNVLAYTLPLLIFQLMTTCKLDLWLLKMAREFL